MSIILYPFLDWSERTICFMLNRDRDYNNHFTWDLRWFFFLFYTMSDALCLMIVCFNGKFLFHPIGAGFIFFFVFHLIDNVRDNSPVYVVCRMSFYGKLLFVFLWYIAKVRKNNNTKMAKAETWISFPSVHFLSSWYFRIGIVFVSCSLTSNKHFWNLFLFCMRFTVTL